MARDFAVLFTDTNARVIKDLSNLEALKKLGTVLINPNMSTIKGIPPHHWKISDMGHVIPMTLEECADRDLKIALHDFKEFKIPLQLHRPIITEVPMEIIVQIPKIIEKPILMSGPLDILKIIIFVGLGVVIGLLCKI